MSRTYKAIGINLKGGPIGESDRLLTILTREYGLIRAIAPGARKHQSRLAGRSGLFVINQLLIVQGKSLDKVTQAETIQSFPGLSSDLRKLTVSQYLAELVLVQALTSQPQEELFDLLHTHLACLEVAPPDLILPRLTLATFQLLSHGGVAPQLHWCCVSQAAVQADPTDPDWSIGFSIAAGGVVDITALTTAPSTGSIPPENSSGIPGKFIRVSEDRINHIGAGKPSLFTLYKDHTDRSRQGRSKQLITQLTALEWTLLCSLENSEPGLSLSFGNTELTDLNLWRRIEYILRQYAQYHFDRPIRSAELIDTCFAIPPTAS